MFINDLCAWKKWMLCLDDFTDIYNANEGWIIDFLRHLSDSCCCKAHEWVAPVQNPL